MVYFQSSLLPECLPRSSSSSRASIFRASTPRAENLGEDESPNQERRRLISSGGVVTTVACRSWCDSRLCHRNCSRHQAVDSLEVAPLASFKVGFRTWFATLPFCEHDWLTPTKQHRLHSFACGVCIIRKTISCIQEQWMLSLCSGICPGLGLRPFYSCSGDILLCRCQPSSNILKHPAGKATWHPIEIAESMWKAAARIETSENVRDFERNMFVLVRHDDRLHYLHAPAWIGTTCFTGCSQCPSYKAAAQRLQACLG